MALEIKDGNFEELLASGKPLVVDFWATWCGPCKKIAPDVEALAEQYKEQVIIGKCDVDDNDELTVVLVFATSRQFFSSRMVKYRTRL